MSYRGKSKSSHGNKKALHWYGSSRSTWRIQAKNIDEARRKIIERDVGKIRRFEKG